MPIDNSNWPPCGVDRADGTLTDAYGDKVGTPAPAGSIKVAIAGDAERTVEEQGYFLEESPDSPEIERAEQCTAKHTYRCDPLTAMQIIQAVGRGKVRQDSQGNVWRVLSCSSRPFKNANVCNEIVIVEESLSFDTPPDQFRIEGIELNPDIMKHPRYAFLMPYERALANNANNAPTIASFKDLQRFIQVIPHSSGPYVFRDGHVINIDSSSTGQGGIWASGKTGADIAPNGSGTNNDHFVAAYELMQKMFIGEQTFYMPGFRIQWTQFFWMPVPLHPGGIIQDPIDEGILPYFFWSTKNPQDNDINSSIFSYAATVAPQLYSSGISWLRLADMPFVWERTWFSVTRTWIGAPWSHWDADVYGNVQQFPDPPIRPLGQAW